MEVLTHIGFGMNISWILLHFNALRNQPQHAAIVSSRPTIKLLFLIFYGPMEKKGNLKQFLNLFWSSGTQKQKSHKTLVRNDKIHSDS
jgi:hypothetical protein